MKCLGHPQGPLLLALPVSRQGLRAAAVLMASVANGDRAKCCWKGRGAVSSYLLECNPGASINISDLLPKAACQHAVIAHNLNAETGRRECHCLLYRCENQLWSNEISCPGSHRKLVAVVLVSCLAHTFSPFCCSFATLESGAENVGRVWNFLGCPASWIASCDCWKVLHHSLEA